MKRIVYLFLGICLASCFSKKPEITGKEGKPLPSFNILLSDSSTNFDTKNIPSGKATVLIYFSPYCAYSRAQITEIINEMSEIKSINIYVITPMPFSAMKSFCNDYQLNKYSNITCGNDYSQYFKAYFDIKGYPYVAIYGKDKILKQAFIGQTNVRRIKEICEE